ncbi:hypothetical protein GGTG_02865 [Gaeumannomyces tritici R3-111a-1]|uniref:Uncharacterized protein n=1 Tax=Gaeumannomyces tritici (strain R3-111a-1) TaxID=644352 RepID=J3NNK8_GAET3|nr:hypothetical protein GGTG_02865 [Gaeumannomyces tritici R3-111a-1]EJT77760.1 hypothetical protein GGTG_02865 [Gaeumannomyces tritici R3-111a-1]
MDPSALYDAASLAPDAIDPICGAEEGNSRRKIVETFPLSFGPFRGCPATKVTDKGIWVA